MMRDVHFQKNNQHSQDQAHTSYIFVGKDSPPK
jgi:hypothetical protein